MERSENDAVGGLKAVEKGAEMAGRAATGGADRWCSVKQPIDLIGFLCTGRTELQSTPAAAENGRKGSEERRKKGATGKPNRRLSVTRTKDNRTGQYSGQINSTKDAAAVRKEVKIGAVDAGGQGGRDENIEESKQRSCAHGTNDTALE